MENGYTINPSNTYNPYRILYEALNANSKDRVYGNVSLNIKLPVKGLTLDVRSGLDMNDEFRKLQRPYYSPGYEKGYYREHRNNGFQDLCAARKRIPAF